MFEMYTHIRLGMRHLTDDSFLPRHRRSSADFGPSPVGLGLPGGLPQAGGTSGKLRATEVRVDDDRA